MRWALLVALVLGGVAAEERIVVALRANAQVAAGQARLADLADITADAATVALLAPVAVQELPDLGRRTVDGGQVRAAIARLVAGRALTITGVCQVERAALAVGPERFSAAAIAAVRAKAGGEAQITVVRAAVGIVVPDDAATAIDLVAEALVDDPIGEIPLRLRVLRAGRELGRGLVVLQVRVLRDQVVAARAIARGATIGLEDLTHEAREAHPGDAIGPGLEAMIGWQARVDIAAGAPLSRRLAAPQPAVRGGRTLELVFIQDRLLLAAPGVALGDGAIGEVIQVRRISDNRAIAAKIIAEGRAQINF